VAPLEPWEKVLVSISFLEDTHGQASCADCHNGDPNVADKESAHIEMIAAPDADAQSTCGNCHNEIVATNAESLHSTQSGYFQTLYSRSIPENHPALDKAFDNHCASCHTTCGDCHIAQPDSVGGGLLDGHNMVKTPPMTRTCTACHGSRVGNEYMGKNEGYAGDVHFRQGRMNCIACHDGASMHDSEGANHRYEGEQSPRCEDCHNEVGNSSDPIAQHSIHQDKLSCQTCHSIEYSSCDTCHVSVSETSGKPIFKVDATYMTFFIGRNTRQSENRPYEFVTVRHIPVSPDNYEFYGENLLPNFNLLPNWAYATPHNIQRITPQNQSCNACHGNPDLFLTADKLKPEELEANRNVIVENVPPAIPGQ
jgi:thiosulfate/3-mercaptopyruvate sulfurtransferase